MARRIRIPFLLDVVLVDDVEEMTQLNRRPDVARIVSAAGGLVHRVIQRRISGTLHVGRDPLPAFAARDDQSRAERQARLEDALDRLDLEREPLASDIRRLGRYVSGQAPDVPVGEAVQQVVGRLFVPTYVATAESYRAAEVIAGWPRANPVKALWWRWSGQLRRSRALLWEKAGDNPACIHATAIAMHNVVTTIERMREMARDPGSRTLAPRDAVQACLVAPAGLLRSATRQARVPFLTRPLRVGSLILFRLERIHAGTRDDAVAFLRGEWSQCPGHRIVPRLLEAVWMAGVTEGSARDWA
jgi:hypothetical protein